MKKSVDEALWAGEANVYLFPRAFSDAKYSRNRVLNGILKAGTYEYAQVKRIMDEAVTRELHASIKYGYHLECVVDPVSIGENGEPVAVYYMVRDGIEIGKAVNLEKLCEFVPRCVRAEDLSKYEEEEE